MKQDAMYYVNQVIAQHQTQERKITLAGVLANHMFQQSGLGESTGVFNAKWKDSTIQKYLDGCNKQLLPLTEHQGICDFTIEQLDKIMREIQLMNDYSDATMAQYELLVWRIFHVGFQEGYCDDILWGTHYSRSAVLTESASPKQAERLLKLRKSLTKQEEQAAIQHLLANPDTLQGQEVGLLIMLLTGMRNNEACGLRFRDIRPLQEYPDTWTLWVFKSTKRNSTGLKASGKTSNSDRILPVFSLLASFVNKRKDHLQHLIDKGKLILPEGMGLDDLPIVCHGNKYLQGCASGDLSVAGKQFLKAICQSDEVVAYCDELVYKSKYQQNGIEEKDGTTYLLRRNFATHLKNMGMNLPKIQYYMGHDIDSLYETRNGFTNEEKLQEIMGILSKHYFNDYSV